ALLDLLLQFVKLVEDWDHAVDGVDGQEVHAGVAAAANGRDRDVDGARRGQADARVLAAFQAEHVALDVAFLRQVPDAGVAADLLVGTQADDQVVLGVDAFGVHDLDGGQQRGDGALHVGRAAAVDLAVFVGSREGLVGPALFDRDDVDVCVDRHFLAIGGGRVAAGDEVDAGTLQGQRNGVDVLLGD